MPSSAYPAPNTAKADADGEEQAAVLVPERGPSDERPDQGAEPARRQEQPDAELAGVEPSSRQQRDQDEHAAGEAPAELDREQGEHPVVPPRVAKRLLRRSPERLRFLGAACLLERTADPHDEQRRAARTRARRRRWRRHVRGRR